MAATSVRPAIPARAAAAWDDQSDVLPQRMDTSQPYPEAVVPGSRGDYQGGLRWCADAARYFGPMVPVAVTEQRRLRREWWDHPEACAHIEAYLGALTVDLLLRWLRDDFDYDAVNRLHPLGKRNPGWLEVQSRKARSLARAYLLRTG